MSEDFDSKRTQSSHGFDGGATNLERNPKSFTREFVQRMTPRSQTACQQLGVLPSELIKRDFKAFYQVGISSEIQKLRFQDFEQTRIETINMVKEQRMKIIRQQEEEQIRTSRRKEKRRQGRSPANTNRSTGSASKPGTRLPPPTPSVQEMSDADAGIIQQEKARMEKILARQNKELEAMLTYETTMANIFEQQEKKMAYRRQREESRALKVAQDRAHAEAKRRKREREMAEAQRQKEREEERERARQNERDRQLREKKEKERQQQMAEAKKRAEEAEQRRMAMEQEHARALELKRKEAEARLRSQERKERKRQERLLAQQNELAEQNRIKREEQAEKYARVMQQKEEQLEYQRVLFEKRMAQQAFRREQFEMEKKNTLLKRRQEYAEKEKQRLLKKRNAIEQEKRRIASIKAKQEKHDLLMAQMELKRREEQAFKQEIHELNLQRKRRNNQRLKRQLEYQRKLQINKIHNDMARTDAIEKQKAALLLQRQRNKIASAQQKANLQQIFTRLKSNPKAWKALALPQDDEDETMPLEGAVPPVKPERRGLTHSQSKPIISPDALKHLLQQASPKKVSRAHRSPSAFGHRKKRNQGRGMSRSASAGGFFVTQGGY